MADPVEQWLEESLHLPGKVQRALRLMTELEANCARIEQQLRTKEQECLQQLCHLKEANIKDIPEALKHEFQSLKTLQCESQSLLKEKVMVNRQISSYIHHEQQRLLLERESLVQTLNRMFPYSMTQKGSKEGMSTSSNGLMSNRNGPLRRKYSQDGAEQDNGSNVSVNSHGHMKPSIKSGDYDERLNMEGPDIVVASKTIRIKSHHNLTSSVGSASKAGSDVSVQSNTPSKRNRRMGHSVSMTSSTLIQANNTATSSTTATPTESLQGESQQLYNSMHVDKYARIGEDSMAKGFSGSSRRSAVGLSGSIPHRTSKHSPSGSMQSTEVKRYSNTSDTSKRHSGLLGEDKRCHTISLDDTKSSRSRTNDSNESCATTTHETESWEGVCPVCHKGETSTEFIKMVACDSCNHWFHFECVGYTTQAQEEEAWFCAKCRKGAVKT